MQLSNTPHNNFFVQLMSRKPIAQAMFDRHLPDDLHQEVDLSLLEPVESKHISDDGVTLYNDVLYRCPLRSGQLAYFFAMAEHQRNPDKDMRIRLAKYNLGIYEDCSRQQYDHMPIIAHFVLYNGKEPWPYSTAFDDYYSDPVLGAKYFHMAPFTLINMPTYLPAQIQEDKALGFCFGAFYASTQPDPYKTFADLMNVPSFEEHIKKLPIED
ncbi:MAG: Rpn family recombination-promoting nuclease/putative transposase, partial [Bacteroidota bacterium]